MAWDSVGKDGTIFIDFLKTAVRMWRKTPPNGKVVAAVIVAAVAVVATGVYVYRKLT